MKTLKDVLNQYQNSQFVKVINGVYTIHTNNNPITTKEVFGLVHSEYLNYCVDYSTKYDDTILICIHKQISHKQIPLYDLCDIINWGNFNQQICLIYPDKSCQNVKNVSTILQNINNGLMFNYPVVSLDIDLDIENNNVIVLKLGEVIK